MARISRSSRTSRPSSSRDLAGAMSGVTASPDRCPSGRPPPAEPAECTASAAFVQIVGGVVLQRRVDPVAGLLHIRTVEDHAIAGSHCAQSGPAGSPRAAWVPATPATRCWRTVACLLTADIHAAANPDLVYTPAQTRRALCGLAHGVIPDHPHATDPTQSTSRIGELRAQLSSASRAGPRACASLAAERMSTAPRVGCRDGQRRSASSGTGGWTRWIPYQGSPSGPTAGAGQPSGRPVSRSRRTSW